MLMDVCSDTEILANSYKFLFENRKVELTNASFWESPEKEDYEYRRLLSIAKDINKSRISILDIGCGKGGIPKKLIENKPKFSFKFEYTGFDVDRIDISESKTKFQSDPRFRFHYINYKNGMYNPSGNQSIEFDFLEDSYDLIWAWSVLSHMNKDDFEIYIRLISSKLSNDGIAFVTCFARYETKISPELTPNFIFLERENEN